MSTCDSPGGLRGAWRHLVEDLDIVLAKDPAAGSRLEVLLYPHIHALWTYRVANWFYRRNRRFMARALSMFGRWVSGIEIHPGATIGRRFFIDHGSAVVIGETVRIGDDVMLYHQVTLGSVGWWRDLAGDLSERRHPELEDGVIVGTNASILGAVTIGARSLVGAHTVVMESVPPDSRVSARSMPVLITSTSPDADADAEVEQPAPTAAKNLDTTTIRGTTNR
ncbi:serine O-acetyltransferase EpsC [Streptomyces sp.]|uniref:serine O-acetyltransferase EpsC n=1 Tax=Streptomyces sp. TaxID=1931 RepID=UPI002F3FBA09